MTIAWSDVVRGINPRLNDRPTTVDPARIPAQERQTRSMTRRTTPAMTYILVDNGAGKALDTLRAVAGRAVGGAPGGSATRGVPGT